MSNIILNTEGTPLNLTAEGPTGGFQALGMAGKKFAVFSLLNKQVLLLSISELKEMPLKAMFGAKWCEQHYESPRFPRRLFGLSQVTTAVA